MSEKTRDYAFMADCHGLCSVTDITPGIFNAMKMRAMANPQRFCVWGSIPLTKDVYKTLQKMCSNDIEGKAALNAIKNAKYYLPKSDRIQLKRNMDRIPNDELDPFWYKPSCDGGS